MSALSCSVSNSCNKLLVCRGSCWLKAWGLRGGVAMVTLPVAMATYLSQYLYTGGEELVGGWVLSGLQANEGKDLIKQSHSILQGIVIS